jgi:hypothetical protein
MSEVVVANACDFLTEIHYFTPRFDQSVQNDVAVEIDYADTHKSFTFGR